MPLDNPNGTDSPDQGMTPDTGTPSPANDQPVATDGGAGEPTPAPASPFSETTIKEMESFDWEKGDPSNLPRPIREKFVPKAEFTRRAQAIADERRQMATEKQAILDLARKIADDRLKPTGPTPEQLRRTELFELAAAGDKKAMEEAVRLTAEDLVAPIRRETTWNQASATAIRLEPAVKAHWDEIQQTINNDPVLKELATTGDFRYADKVMLALGLEHRTRDQAAFIERQKAELDTLKAKLVQFEKARVAALPDSTTKAGTSAGRLSPGEFDKFSDAAYSAFIAAGGRPQDWH